MSASSSAPACLGSRDLLQASRLLLAASLLLLNTACNCLAGGWSVSGGLLANLPPKAPEVFLCTRPEGGRCVQGEVTEGETPHFEATQVSSATGDQNRQCDEKPFLVVRAENCEEVVVDLRPQQRSVRDVTLTCVAP